MDTSDEWIQARTGIKERRFADPDQATSDMAVPAAKQALDRAGMKAEDIDYVILATMTPDMYFPGSAPFLQAKLGLSNIPCLDIRQQCVGFLFGLQLADALIRSEQYRNVLVVGAEVHACFMPWSWDVLLGSKPGPVSPEEYAVNTRTRDRTVLFGDGAGAVVLSPTSNEDKAILDFLLKTDGTQAERLCTRAGGSAFRPYFAPEMTATGDVTPMVEGREVFRLAVRLMPQVAQEVLERNDLKVDEVDLLIMHQANLRINEAAQQRLGLPDEKVGRINLEGFRGVVAVGGFSYADVLDSAKGWAGVIRYNEGLREQFQAFYEREETFSLGVCNGCQLLALLGWIPWPGIADVEQPRFIQNASGRFESRFAAVTIENSPAEMLEGMEGSTLGIWVAHGEGRAYFPEPSILERVERESLAPIRLVDDERQVTETYPFNPNGSPQASPVCVHPTGGTWF